MLTAARLCGWDDIAAADDATLLTCLDNDAERLASERAAAEGFIAARSAAEARCRPAGIDTLRSLTVDYFCSVVDAKRASDGGGGWNLFFKFWCRDQIKTEDLGNIARLISR